MNATDAIHDTLRGKLTALEGRLDAQVQERAKTMTLLDQMTTAIQQMQGAIAVLRELLTETESPEEPMA